LGASPNASEQHPQQRVLGHTGRAHDDSGRSPSLRAQLRNVVLPAQTRLADEPSVEPVYDLINCGPRQRFVVRGSDGPVIVHNCVQAAACDQLDHGMQLIESQGYSIVFHVHDEVVCEVPDNDDYTVDAVAEMLCSRFRFNEGVPLTAAGFETDRYYKPD
jgi:hypothetical protein